MTRVRDSSYSVSVALWGKGPALGVSWEMYVTNGRFKSRIRRDGPWVIVDLLVVLFAYPLALLVERGGHLTYSDWLDLPFFLVPAAAAHLLSNHVFGLYERMWRYASVPEARRLIFSGAAAGAVVVLISLVAPGPVGLFPLPAAVFGAAVTFLGIGAARFRKRLMSPATTAPRQRRRRILVVGAGDAGAMVLRDVLRHPSLGIMPLGLLDDDSTKQDRTIHGVRVVGKFDDLPRLVEELEVDQVLFAIPSATGELVRRTADLCDEAGVPLKVLPSLNEIVGTRVTAKDIRDLRIEDLLGREQVEIDLDAIQSTLAGRRVLVTGGGGSIGSEIARQVALFGPAELVLLDHDETHLHDAITDIPSAVAALGDIRDETRVREVFEMHDPEIVFHAAAHKHVPLLESHPAEALLTNVVGTKILAEAALRGSCRSFVLISTDKAVAPESVMGATKRLAEQTIWSLLDRKEIFTAVRFGNVLGSRGSVIPTFLRQIEHGGPVTVTHPEMTRYFMSVQEAVRLVLQAAALARGGEVFTLDMGQPVNIVELAKKVIRLAGHVPEQDIEITYIGTRPGEKLFEDIVDDTEPSAPSQHRSINVSRPRRPPAEVLTATIEELTALAGEKRTNALHERIRSLAREDLAQPAAGKLSP